MYVYAQSKQFIIIVTQTKPIAHFEQYEKPKQNGINAFMNRIFRFRHKYNI